MATYRTCVADAKTQKQELEDTKVTALRQIQEVIRQSDQTIKSVCDGHLVAELGQWTGHNQGSVWYAGVILEGWDSGEEAGQEPFLAQRVTAGLV